MTAAVSGSLSLLLSISSLSGPRIQKLQGNIATPMQLMFSRWCDESCLNRNNAYQLCSVIMHCGSRSNTGHYTAYVRAPPKSTAPVFQKCSGSSKKDGACESSSESQQDLEAVKDVTYEVVGQQDVEWLFFDDGDVKIMSEAQIVVALSPLCSSASTPYMLAYRRLQDNHGSMTKTEP